MFRHKAQQRGVAHQFEIDSAGTGAWHAGEPPDARVCSVAKKNGISMMGIARQIKREDFMRFDHLICMDNENLEHILALGAPREKVRLLLACVPDADCLEVPDPYYGGADGFERVFRLVDSACERLLDQLLGPSRA